MIDGLGEIFLWAMKAIDADKASNLSQNAAEAAVWLTGEKLARAMGARLERITVVRGG